MGYGNWVQSQAATVCGGEGGGEGGGGEGGGEGGERNGLAALLQLNPSLSWVGATALATHLTVTGLGAGSAMQTLRTVRTEWDYYTLASAPSWQ